MSPRKIVALSGNTHRPSKSAALARHLGGRLEARTGLAIDYVDLVDAGRGLGAAFTPADLSDEARHVIETVAGADVLIVSSPVYKGAYPGLLKHLFDLIAPEALAGKPVVIAATGGGLRHALVVEHSLRPLLAFFCALTVPTAVYASDGDFVDGELAEPVVRARADAAIEELIRLADLRPALRRVAAA